MARQLRRVFFALIPLALLLAVGEVLARTVWTPPALSEGDLSLPPHPTRIWGLQPGMAMGPGPGNARIGPDGLRQAPVRGAAHRILTLGDSNVFGHGLPDADTLHERLAAELDHRGVRADVFCGGVPGYSTEQSLLLLDEVGWALHPDLLVVANLLSDSTQERFQDRPLLAELHTPQRRATRSFLDHSRLLLWLVLQVQPPTRAELQVTWLRPPGVAHKPRVPVDDYRDNLLGILAEARDHGVGVVFLELATRRVTDGKPDGDAWRQVMRELARSEGLPIVDGAAALRVAGLDASTGFLEDVHVNAAGSHAYAAALAAALVDAGWPGNRLLPPAAGMLDGDAVLE